jgi:hypothetical protein
MGAKEFDFILRKLIPATVNVFKKLEVGDPYHFDHWANDRSGATCMYYWFSSRTGSKKNCKRVLVSEVRTALKHLRTTGALDRKSFRILCPISESAGPCGFAVAGRMLEELGVATYSNRHVGFTLTDRVKAASLLDCPT